VREKAAEELLAWERHLALPVVVSIVLPREKRLFASIRTNREKPATARLVPR
jgi:hypothetical protein